MDPTSIITPKDLEDFANRSESQRVVPELIYWLIKASAQVDSSQLSVCRIPYGDSVNQPGHDGLVEIDKPHGEFITKGRACWEIGTGRNPQKKATKEFKRCAALVPPGERRESAFVFVTPRSSGEDGWSEPGQTRWLRSRQKHDWQAVRILDGVKLADWLREFPAIAKWFAREIDLTTSLDAFATATERWRDIQHCSKTGNPPLPAKLFTIGRSAACSALDELFQGKRTKVWLTAEGLEDVNDFVAAFLASLDEETGRAFANRCLYVKDRQAWLSLCHRSAPQVLVAHPRLGLELAENVDLHTEASKHRHAIVIPVCGYIPGSQDNLISLRSPSGSVIEDVLREAGFDHFRTRELGDIGAGRLAALVRHWRGADTVPGYAISEGARGLAQANLIGRWDGKKKGDQEAMSALLGKPYGDWIEALRPELHRPDTPLIQTDEKWKMLARGEAWAALGPRLTDEDLDRFKQAILHVLGEDDPQFDLPKDERYAASIHGKVLQHSHVLREGLAETLALLGSRPKALTQCSLGKCEAIAFQTVTKLLDGANWRRWAALDSLLPLLAEASPDAFMEAVENGLTNLKESPFNEVYAQEGDGVLIGSNYTTGLLWGLETLAWRSDYLARVTLILGDLAAIDPGGKWSNRPGNSLRHIFLPWHRQTCAPIGKRKAAVEALLREQPNIGWKLLLGILPSLHDGSEGCHRPIWQDFIAPDWRNEVTETEYLHEVEVYCELAMKAAGVDAGRLGALIEKLPQLPQNAQKVLLAHLRSETIMALPEAERAVLWESLTDLCRSHRKYADADWAMPEAWVKTVESEAASLAPQSPELLSQHLFRARDFELMEAKGDYAEQRAKLDARRGDAIREILNEQGMPAVLRFAESTEEPTKVGDALALVATDADEEAMLPHLLLKEESAFRQLIDAYVWRRFRELGWDWVDRLLSSPWNIDEKLALLLLLPFMEGTWDRVAQHLADEHPYWFATRLSPSNLSNFARGIGKLLEHSRPNAAIKCLHELVMHGSPIDPELVSRSFSALLDCEDPTREIDHDAIISVLTWLQNQPEADQSVLSKIEWNFLPWLGEHSGGSPKTLAKQLTCDPAFFCELIAYVFKSKKPGKENEPSSERSSDTARHAYRLLKGWKLPPGFQADGSFDPDQLARWLTDAKRIATESGHLEVALNYVGRVLVNWPADKDGLWIHHSVAAIVDAKESGRIRSGFNSGLRDKHSGCRFAGGSEELEFARDYRMKADALEDHGYARFATSIRELAAQYEHDAAREARRDPFDE